MFKKTEKLWDILGEIFAVLLVLVYAVLIINANWPFIKNATLYNVLEGLRSYGSIILVGIVGLEAISKRNIIFQILFVAIMALVVIFMFFPNASSYLVGLINK